MRKTYEDGYYEKNYYDEENIFKQEEINRLEFKEEFKKGENNAYANKLFKEYAKYPNDRELRNEIVAQYYDFAIKLSYKYTKNAKDREDVEQVAYEALIKAVERFDISKGYTFMTYATPYVIGYIKRYFRDLGQLIKVPRNIYVLSIKISDAREKLVKKLDREPTEKEIADYLGVELVDVRETLCATYEKYNPESLDAVHNDSEGTGGSLIDTLVNDDSFKKNFMIQELINKYTRDFTDEEYYTFTRIVLYNETQNSLAEELNVNQTTIGRRAKRLKKRFIEKLIEDFLYDSTDEEYFIFKDLYVENKSVKKVSKEMNMKEKEVKEIGKRMKEKFLIEFLE